MNNMRSSRGMGIMKKSKMPTGKTITRKDDPNKVKEYAKGGPVKKDAKAMNPREKFMAMIKAKKKK